MSISALVRKLVDAGATPEVIALAVEAMESQQQEIETAKEQRRTKDRERKRKSRGSHAEVTRTSEDGVCDTSPCPPKVPPTPPSYTPLPPKSHSDDGYSDDFETAWRAYPAREGGNPKRKAWGAWKQRLRDGHQPAEMIAGVERYAAHIRAAGNEGTPYVKQAASFFGKEDPPHFLADWGQQEAKPQPPASDHEWDMYVAAYAQYGTWHSKCGKARPGEDGCQAPPQILERYGYMEFQPC